VASAKRPMEYWRFINRLRLLEVCIPSMGEVNSSFMLFRWGGEQGCYGAIPNGHHHVMINHDPAFVMPVAEIQNCLSHLEPDGSLSVAFWAIQDHKDDQKITDKNKLPSRDSAHEA